MNKSKDYVVQDYVVLIDRNNKKIGVEEKMKAHIDAKLHRAFSVFVFNSKGELLIQQRAKEKYHCGGLWANTVCSHPRPNESYSKATHRRLSEEMGFDCKLTKKFCFTYKVKFDNELTENEYDCVFVGKFDGDPKPNPSEVVNYKWISMKDLKKDIKKSPEKYTEWLKIALKKMKYDG
jgi:isopentenyl-diphosphate Delta-isomerase